MKLPEYWPRGVGRRGYYVENVKLQNKTPDFVLMKYLVNLRKRKEWGITSQHAYVYDSFAMVCIKLILVYDSDFKV
jgi:hypothetical protein